MPEQVPTKPPPSLICNTRGYVHCTIGNKRLHKDRPKKWLHVTGLNANARKGGVIEWDITW